MKFRQAISAALAACFFSLTGCAEINQRGGFVAEIEDWALFRATTKSHRLLRSYLLVGGLMSLANTSRLNAVERGQVAGNLRTALELIREAYYCLYPDRIGQSAATLFTNDAIVDFIKNTPVTSCIFFDTRMAQIDYAIYRMAGTVLLDPDSQSVLATVRDKMLGEVPVLGKAVRAATKTIDAANETAGVVYDATAFLNAIVSVGRSSGNRWLYVLPIYRDIIEFDMRLVIQSLRYKCPTNPNYTRNMQSAICVELNDVEDNFKNGNGDMRYWREYLRNSSTQTHVIEAYPIHFSAASRWVYYSCASVFAPAADREDDKVVTSVLEVCKPLLEFVDIKTRKFVFKYRTREGAQDSETLTVKRKIDPREVPVQPSTAQTPVPSNTPAAAPPPQPAPAHGARPLPPGTTGAAPSQPVPPGRY